MIAGLAWRVGSLSASGAMAAVAIGTATMVAGRAWGALLVAYFVASTLLSRLGRARKQQRTASVVGKGDVRDAVQVFANGGLFAACLVLLPGATGAVETTLTVAALGALAASTADTWATEIGTLLGGSPRSCIDMKVVQPGTSGAVTAVGLVAMCAGAFALAYAASHLGLTSIPTIIAMAGIAGALTDTILGATLQQRLRCPRCDQATERNVHSCGTPTSYAGGLEWMSNDAVNFAATIAGAAVAVTLRGA